LLPGPEMEPDTLHTYFLEDNRFSVLTV